MSLHLDFSEQAKKDIEYHKKSGNKALLKKMLVLLNELTEHPFEGTGKPEALKHQLTGMWSRRINQEHRIVYEVTGEIIYVYSLKGHYQ
ncbi:Txe/YoeB family addiction module toxin [Daejeonella sp. JGW-45]|uniref:Txe/YoeB family addiction module toxin n=1 Tax=Daejeonella sp. JGW-45 TaxID=3034148 RepID=UPI0023EAC2BE|nr:Txe/YoeB family addiction module toxin [Daejeonella sp. JGW-45]